MAKKMKKFQIARPYQSYEYMDIPDNFTVKCPDGSTIDMEITEVHGRNGERFTYEGGNPFVSAYIDFGVGGTRYFESEEPQSTSAYITVFCERTAPNGYDFWNDKKGVKRIQLEDSPSFDEIISKTEGLISEIWDYAQDYAKIVESARKSKKAKTMVKNKAISKTSFNITWYFDKLVEAFKRVERNYDDWYASNLPSNEEESRLYNEIDSDIDDLTEKMDEYNEVLNRILSGYEASAKKSMNKSKYSDIRKRLAKLGGFTKDEEEIEIDDDDVVEIEEEDGEKVVEIESKEEHAEEVADGEESEDDNLNECNSNKSRKTVKGMRTSKKRMKMRKEDDDDDDSARWTGKPADWEEDDEDSSEKRCKSRKTKKAEDMPADADDFKEDNQKGSGSAGSDMPEDADDNQNENDAGTGNAGSELPEDADDQQDIKESARKARIARMKRSARKSVNRPPVRKFSVTPGGQPNQESFNQRYQQSPMTRQAIDRHFGNSAEKSFNEVDMMNERIGNLMKSKRNPSSSNGVPKRIR